MPLFLNRFPLVSIIIPTYNRCLYLKETLISIIEQTYLNFEIIIVSDGFSEETSLMVRDLNDSRCRLYTLEHKSTGPAFVRNYGVAKARGSLLAFCDDDDIWLPQKLEKQVALMVADNEIALTATNVSYFGEVKKQILFFAGIKAFLNKFNFFPKKYLLTFYNCLVISSSMVRKEIFNQYKFNEKAEYQGHEDLDLWLRICSSNKAFVIPQCLTAYRVHANQLSTYLNKSYKEQSLKMLKERWPDFNLAQKVIFKIREFIYWLLKY